MYKDKGYGKAWVTIENFKSFSEESEYLRHYHGVQLKDYHGVQLTGGLEKDEITITMSE